MQKKVFLVYDAHESPPYGIFSSEELAKKYIADLKNYDRETMGTTFGSVYYIKSEEIDE